MEPPSRAQDADAVWLRAALGLPAGLPAALRVERIGEGFGLGGTAARLHLGGAPGLPRTLVAKACPFAPGEAEARFYREAASRLDLRLPALHGWFPDAGGNRGVLLLGDVGPARQGDALAGLAPEDATAVVTAAASWHAAFPDRADDPLLASLADGDGDPSGEAARAADAVPAFLGAWGDRIPAAARAATERLPRLLPAARAALARLPRTLLHGDLHADNALFPPSGPPVILDWACIRRGPAAADFVHFLLEGITAEARRTGEEALSRAWADAMARRGVPGSRAGHLLSEADHAIVPLWAGIVRSAARWTASPTGEPRKGLLVANLVRNGAAYLADRGIGARA